MIGNLVSLMSLYNGLYKTLIIIISYCFIIDVKEQVQNVCIKHNTNLSSACGTPEYTNYTGTFSGCLDYIFYQTDYLTVEQVIPMPSEKELSVYTGLPSVVSPSDHIALCVDLKWLK